VFAASDVIGAARLAAAEPFSHLHEVLHHRPQARQFFRI
jgi:hypothetical protein